IQTAGDQLATIRSESQAVNPSLVAVKLPEFFAGAQIPDAHRVVGAASGQDSAIRRQGENLGTRFETITFLPGRCLPDSDGVLSRCRSKIGTNDHATVSGEQDRDEIRVVNAANGATRRQVVDQKESLNRD